MTSILKYNIIPESISANDLKSLASTGTGLQTLQGRNELWPLADSSNVEISDETCGNSSVSKSLVASNGGVLHYVDQLFVPPGAICPDVIFAAEQRSESRISVYVSIQTERFNEQYTHTHTHSTHIILTTDTVTIVEIEDFNISFEARTNLWVWHTIMLREHCFGQMMWIHHIRVIRLGLRQ